MDFSFELLKILAKFLAFGVLGTILMLGLLYAAFQFSGYRSIVRMGRLACQSCGKPLGTPAIREALRDHDVQIKLAWEEIERECKDGEEMFVTFDENMDVNCPHCAQTTVVDSRREKVQSNA